MCKDQGDAEGCRYLVHEDLHDPVLLYHETDSAQYPESPASCSLRWLIKHHPDEVSQDLKVCATLMLCVIVQARVYMAMSPTMQSNYARTTCPIKCC